MHADKTGQALDKVTVFAVPSLSGSFTNVEGKYLIAPEETDTLIVFRKKGFDDIKVPRKRYAVINVALSEASLAKRKKGN